MQKFVEKTGGVIILQHRLQRLWFQPRVWLICFAVLFGKDVATVNLEQDFSLFGLLETFASDSNSVIIYPEILPVLTAMLRKGLVAVIQDQSNPESTHESKYDKRTSIQAKEIAPDFCKIQRSETMPTPRE